MAEAKTKEKKWTKKDVQAFLDEMSKQISEGKSAYVHSMLALNRVITLPNANELFTEDLKAQAKELWLKVKATGLQLGEPPFLFGQPQFRDEKTVSEIDGGDEIAAPIVPKSKPKEEVKPNLVS